MNACSILAIAMIRLETGESVAPFPTAVAK